MATFYIPNESGWSDNGTLGATAKLRLKVERSYNSVTNKSTLTITPQSYNDRWGKKCYLLKNASLTLNGNTVYSGGGTDQQSTTIYVQYTGSATWANATDQSTGNIVAWTATVDHASDGSATFNFGVSFRFYSTSVYTTFYNVTGSKTVTEPRASSVSASNGTFGSVVQVTVTRQSTAYTHTVIVSCLGVSTTLATKSSTTSLSWSAAQTAVSTYAPLLTNSLTTTATITCTTYSGDTAIGSTSVTITMTLPSASVKPSTSIATSDPNGYASTYGGFVATKSKITVTLTNTFQYNATLAATSITANGQTFTASPATTSEVVYNNSTVKAKITDSRGVASSEVTASITILEYAAPVISAMSIRRCNQDGTANDAGAYCKVSYTVSVTALNDHNSKNLTLKYKKRSASTWTSQSVTLSSYTQSSDVIFAADTDSTYDVQLVLADDFNSGSSAITRTQQLSTAYTFLNFGSGADAGIGIGMVNQTQKAVELEENWKVFHGLEQILPRPFHAAADAFANSSSYQIDVDDDESLLAVLSGAGARDLLIVHANSSGLISCSPVIGASGYSVTTATNKITISNSSGAYIFLLMLRY